MMDVKGLIDAASQLFNEGKYAGVIEKLEQANKITHESTPISEQIDIQSGLGRCYFEQGIKTKDEDKANKLFKKAVEYYQQWLELTKQLTDEHNSIQQKIWIQTWLGRCYFERIKRIKSTPEAEKFVTQASKYFSAAFRHIAQINDEREQEKLKKGIHPMKTGILISTRKSKKHRNRFSKGKLHNRKMPLQPCWRFSILRR